MIPYLGLVSSKQILWYSSSMFARHGFIDFSYFGL
jgi:hypothetical protein